MIKKFKLLNRLVAKLLIVAMIMTALPQTSMYAYAENAEAGYINDVENVEECTSDADDEDDLYYDISFQENNYIGDFMKSVNYEIYSEMPSEGKVRPDDESVILYTGTFTSSMEKLLIQSDEKLKCSEHEILYFRISYEYQDDFKPWHDGHIGTSLVVSDYDESVAREQKIEIAKKAIRTEKNVEYNYFELSREEYLYYRNNIDKDPNNEGEIVVNFTTIASTEIYSSIAIQKSAYIDDIIYWKSNIAEPLYDENSDYKWEFYYSTEGDDPSEFEFKHIDNNIIENKVIFSDAIDSEVYDDNPTTRNQKLYRGYIVLPKDLADGNPKDIWFYTRVECYKSVVAVSNVITNSEIPYGWAEGTDAANYSGITMIKYIKDTDEYEVLKKDVPCEVHETEDARFGIALVSKDGQTITPMSKLSEISEDSRTANDWSQQTIDVDKESDKFEFAYHSDPDETSGIIHLEKIVTEDSTTACNQWYHFIQTPTYSAFSEKEGYDNAGEGLVYITIKSKNLNKYGYYYNTFPIKILPAEEGVKYFQHGMNDSGVVNTTIEQFNENVRKHLLKHEEEFTLLADKENIGNAFSMENALDAYEEREGMMPNEGECLEGILEEYAVTKTQSEENENCLKYTFNVKYITTLKQENDVNAWIQNVLFKDLKDVKDDTDSKKAKAAYDYVTSHVSGVVGSNTESERKNPINHTIYTAMNKGFGTSQSYALLYSRLCRELGLQTRVIYGKDADNHTYNIVRIKDAEEGDYWFYVDCSSGIFKQSYNEFSRTEELDRFSSARFILNYIREIYGFNADDTAKITNNKYEDVYTAPLYLCKQYMMESMDEYLKAGSEFVPDYYTVTLLKDITIDSTTELDFATYKHTQEQCDTKAHYSDATHIDKDYSSYVKLDLNGHKLTGKKNADVSIRVSEAKNGSFDLQTDGDSYLKGKCINCNIAASGRIILGSVICNLNGSSATLAYSDTTDTYTVNVLPRENYTFNGWTDSDGNVVTTLAIANGTTETKEYTANWGANEYSISYELNGGSIDGINITGYSHETDTFTLLNPTKPGYTFTGWTGSNGDVPSKTVTIEKGTTGNKQFTANWSVNKYTIEYVLDGGRNNIENPVEYTVETDTITLKNPVKGGYKFLGWYQDSTQITEIAKGSTGNLVLTAKWERSESVPFDDPKKDDETNNGWGDIDDSDKGIINPKEIDVNTISITGIHDVTYTGAAITFDIRVYRGTDLLREGTDYSINYKNNKKVPAENATQDKLPTVIIKGKGIYAPNKGENAINITKEFNIKPVDIKNFVVSNDTTVKPKNNKPVKVVPTLTANGTKLKNKSEYIVEYPEGNENGFIDPGTYAIQLKGTGNYTGEITSTFTLIDSSAAYALMSKATVAGLKKTLPYSAGNAVVQNDLTVNIKINKTNTKLVEGTDYEVEYKDNTEIGNATVILKAKAGNDKGLVGEKVLAYKISGTAISKTKIELKAALSDTKPIAAYSYTGKQIKPFVVISTKTKNPEQLVEGVDYTLRYQKNTNVGTATVFITGKGNYTGTVKKTFTIKAIDFNKDPSIVVEKDVENTTDSYKIKVKVYFNGRKLKEGKDYTLSYKNNKKPGLATDGAKAPTVIVKGKGNFAKTKSLAFDILQTDK